MLRCVGCAGAPSLFCRRLLCERFGLETCAGMALALVGGMRTRRRAYKGIAMEGMVAAWYARSTASDLRRFDPVARLVKARAEPGSRILEVAPGPGYLAIELARSGFSITGLDVSESFVRIARAHAQRAGVDVDFQHGNAAEMPFRGGSFDFIVCVAAFKNFADPAGALDEFHRVLRPARRALIQDLRKEASIEDIEHAVRDMRLSVFNRAITRWVFRHVLLKQAYSADTLRGLVARSAFGSGALVNDGVGFQLWLTRPEDASAPATRT